MYTEHPGDSNNTRLREDEGDSSADALLEPRTHEASLVGSWASTLDRDRFQSHEPQSRSLCGRRVCRAARMRCDLPSPCVHTHTHMTTNRATRTPEG